MGGRGGVCLRTGWVYRREERGNLDMGTEFEGCLADVEF